MKHLYFVILCLLSGYSSAQTEFTPVMDHQRVLSGSFAELRSNHFHSGVDFKTQGVIGKPIYSPFEGYVSRVSVSIWGYGHALYITHPNGYTTVYGHLSGFSPKIDSIVRREQYSKQNFSVDITLPADSLKISQKELIAYSGNTGSSEGPHLHFEVRNTATNNPVDPLSFPAFSVKDTKAPTIKAVYILSIDSTNAVPTTYPRPTPIQTRETKAIGKIKILVDAYDTMDDAPNKNGVKDIQLFVDSKKAYHFRAEEISFDNTRDINHHILYPYFVRSKERLVSCSVSPFNTLTMYLPTEVSPVVDIKEGGKHHFKLVLSDLAGNSTTREFTVTGDKNGIKPFKSQQTKDMLLLTPDKQNEVLDNGFSVTFPKGSFYEPIYVDFKAGENGIFTLKNPSNTLLKGNFIIKFDLSQYPEEERKKMQITRPYIDANGGVRHSFMGGKVDGNSISLSTSSFGNFGFSTDKTKPVITPQNFSATQKLQGKILKIKISDSQSGIKSFAVYVDGRWVLAKYEYKNSELSIHTTNEGIGAGSHTIKIVLTDNVDNTAIFESKFSI